MKKTLISTLLLSYTSSLAVQAHNYQENNGQVAIEAEHFSSQHLDDKRRWLIFSNDTKKHQLADNDPTHLSQSSNNSYIELLPDTRTNHHETLIHNENFSDIPGTAAVISYPVYFTTAGKYYVWARAFSTGSEDNGIHLGLNGQWPESGQRLQLCDGKHQWTWSSAQRVEGNHCGINNTIYLDIPTPGLHTINISMREDGFELDKLILSNNRSYQPKGIDLPASIKPQQTLAKKKILLGIDQYERVLYANKHFNYLDNISNDSIPYYDHKDETALAINAGKKAYRHKFAKASYTVKKKVTTQYNLTLITLGEIDGESNYQVLLNQKVLAQFKNPETSVDYQENYFHIKQVTLKLGDVLTVASMADTNGKIPENNETAYARGRWRALVLSLPEEE